MAYSYIFVVHQLYGGGAERVVSVLASELAERGIDTHVIIHYKAEKEYMLSDKVKVHYDRDDISNKGNAVVRKIRKLFRIRRIVKSCGDCYVLPFCDFATIHTFLATLFLKNKKFISTIRIDPRNVTGIEATLAKIITWFSYGLFAQNDSEKEYYPGFVQRKTFIVPNPVNSAFLKCHHEYKNEIVKIVSVGRLSKQKNFQLIIDVAQLLQKDYPQLKFLIYGDGEEKDNLQASIKNKKLTERVILKGNVENIADELNNADMFIMSSDFEGMPNALMEAMALGLPSISTNCPSGPADLIKNDEYGVLVPINDVKAMAVAVEIMISNIDFAYSLGKKAKEMISDQYSASIIAKRLTFECNNLRKSRGNE